ncbi:glycoside hydrolase superfamily [Lactifluus volemus]|nr:glycoside hydrolase superfamily [Lactifluus volemus]
MKYTSVIYSFANTAPNGNFIALEDSDKQLLPQFVQTAHQNSVLALCLSEAGVMQLVSQYKLDGIEFDWEYPTKLGIGCNVVSTNDSANFLSFLTTLRSQQGAQKLIISAAVSLTLLSTQMAHL